MIHHIEEKTINADKWIEAMSNCSKAASDFSKECEKSINSMVSYEIQMKKLKAIEYLTKSKTAPWFIRWYWRRKYNKLKYVLKPDMPFHPNCRCTIDTLGMVQDNLQILADSWKTPDLDFKGLASRMNCFDGQYSRQQQAAWNEYINPPRIIPGEINKRK